MGVFGDPFVLLTKIGEVAIDVTLHEDHVYDTYVTDHPVEDGTVFTDHQVLLPVVLNIEGRVTDASITFLGIPKLSKANEAYRSLVELQTRRQPFTVVTGLNVYENMILQNVSFPRTARDGQSIRFHATLREIQVIGDNNKTNRQRVAPDVEHSALPPVHRGFIQLV